MTTEQLVSLAITSISFMALFGSLIELRPPKRSENGVPCRRRASTWPGGLLTP